MMAREEASRGGRPAVFLDRDGTVIEEVNYLSRIEDLRPIDGVSHSLQMLRDAGFSVVLITNQSGVARGYFTEDFVRLTHRELEARIGFAFDGIYYCTHGPDGGCRCRKPAPGMVEQAAADLGLDITRSFVVGDKTVDLELARQAGMPGILVLTGYGGRIDQPTAAEHVAPDINEACRWIITRASAHSKGRE